MMPVVIASLHTALRNPIVRGAVTGVVAAAATDLHAFKQWNKWSDVASYSWGTATFRWVQGAALGALTALGLGVF